MLWMVLKRSSFEIVAPSSMWGKKNCFLTSNEIKKCNSHVTFNTRRLCKTLTYNLTTQSILLWKVTSFTSASISELSTATVGRVTVFTASGKIFVRSVTNKFLASLTFSGCTSTSLAFWKLKLFSVFVNDVVNFRWHSRVGLMRLSLGLSSAFLVEIKSPMQRGDGRSVFGLQRLAFPL